MVKLIDYNWIVKNDGLFFDNGRLDIWESKLLVAAKRPIQV